MVGPLFSLIIPTLNEEDFLPRLLTSLVHQTSSNFEVIIVDGKSKDGTVRVAKGYKTKLPMLTVLSSTVGVSHQRNVGATKATGQYLVFVDADSELLPYAIERMEAFVTQHASQFVTSWFRVDSEKPSESMYALIGNLYMEGTLVIKKTFAPGGFSIIRRDAFDEVHGYDETMVYGEDMEISKQLASRGIPLQIIKEVLFVWSLRRFRKEGTLKLINIYALTGLIAFLTKLKVKSVPGYETGGHIYAQRRSRKSRSLFINIERKLKQLVREIVDY